MNSISKPVSLPSMLTSNGGSGKAEATLSTPGLSVRSVYVRPPVARCHYADKEVRLPLFTEDPDEAPYRCTVEGAGSAALKAFEGAWRRTYLRSTKGPKGICTAHSTHDLGDEIPKQTRRDLLDNSISDKRASRKPAFIYPHEYTVLGRIRSYCRVQFMGFIKKQPVAEGGLAIGCVEGTLHKN